MAAPTGMEDRVGLERAYKAEVGLYDAGDTLYIAGTRDLGDWYDDLKIPFQATNKSWREREASMVLDAKPQLTRVVGHSLGGAVALDLQKRNPSLHSVTYGAPVLDINPFVHNERYRHMGDPVSAFDWGAESWLPPKGGHPHSYQDLAARWHDFPSV